MKVLVTGATGFLGHHLFRRLVGEGHAVTAFHRSTSNVADLPASGVALAIGDVADADAVRRAVDGQDVVVHAAAHLAYWRGFRDEQSRVNLDGTRNVARACRAAGVGRMVHVSSVAAVGIPAAGDGPADENFPFNLRESGLNYHLSKRQGEEAVNEEVARGLDAVIVNPGSIFGPAHRGYRGGEMMEKVRGKRVVLYFVGGINAVHVEDVVDGIARAMTRGRSGQRYILGGDNVTYRHIVEVAMTQLGQRSMAVPVPPIITGTASAIFESLGRLSGRRPPFTRDTHYCSQRRQFYASDKAQAELGYTARSFETIVGDYLVWSTNQRPRVHGEARFV